MAIISDMMSGYGAIHAKNRWKTSASQLSDDDWYKMFVSFEYMKKVVNELKILAPYMSTFNTENNKKIKLLRKTLEKEHLNWHQLLYEIYETLETKGDFFAYWSTSENSKVDDIPRLKVLKSECIEDIILDPITNEPTSYIYKEMVSEEKVDEKTGFVTTVNSRGVTWIFTKGYIRINDSYKYSDSGGFKIFSNGADYADEIRLIHIPSFKKQSEKFSEIPASQYVDACLLLDKIDTNRDIINDHLGFPFPFIIGGKIDAENSQLIPGGAGYIEPDEWAKASGKMPEMVKMEISGDITSIISQKEDVVSDLYKKVCLIRESLEERLSGSDSSRNISQLRLGIEQKNTKYYENIAEGFAPYFRSVLKENGAISDKEFNDKVKYTLELPDVLINNSIFDDLLIVQMKRALGKSTLTSEMKKEGKTDSEIEKRKEEIIDEMYGKNSDMSFPDEVIDRVSNANNVSDDSVGLDNNFK